MAQEPTDRPKLNQQEELGMRRDPAETKSAAAHPDIPTEALTGALEALVRRLWVREGE